MIDFIASMALAVWIYVTVVFFLALVKRDNSIMDIAWGLGFVAVSLLSFFYEPGYTLRHLLVTSLVCLWGLRLAVHIAIRNWGRGEDYRYAKWRRDWGRWFILRSYFQIFILQGIFLLLVSSPLIAVNHSPSEGFSVLDFLGLFIWIIGFFFETVGDLQLMNFKRDKQNKGRIMTRGLWRFTRHPNYFGEVTMWWGIFIIALSAEFGWATVISPLLITFLLLRVSGVAMLEKRYTGNKEFVRYARRTSAFFPWFPKQKD